MYTAASCNAFKTFLNKPHTFLENLSNYLFNDIFKNSIPYLILIDTYFLSLSFFFKTNNIKIEQQFYYTILIPLKTVDYLFCNFISSKVFPHFIYFLKPYSFSHHKHLLEAALITKEE